MAHTRKLSGYTDKKQTHNCSQDYRSDNISLVVSKVIGCCYKIEKILGFAEGCGQPNQVCSIIKQMCDIK